MENSQLEYCNFATQIKKWVQKHLLAIFVPVITQPLKITKIKILINFF